MLILCSDYAIMLVSEFFEYLGFGLKVPTKINGFLLSINVNYHKCVLMYKSLNNIAPDYLTERFMKVSETHNRQLRSADNDLLKVPYSRTKYYDNSFTVSGAKLWNSLPLNIRQSPSIDSFKCRIKAHLLETNS